MTRDGNVREGIICRYGQKESRWRSESERFMDSGQKIKKVIVVICLLFGALFLDAEVDIQTTCANGVRWRYGMAPDGGALYLNGLESVSGPGREGLPRRLVVPAALDGHPVTRIGSELFHGCTNLEEVLLPPSIERTGRWIFAECISLRSVILPAHIESLSAGLFRGCDRLESITIPASVVKLGPNLFGGCRGLKTVVLPDKLVDLPDSVFHDCEHLATLTLPNTLTSIGVCAFAQCRGLREIDLPECVTNVADGAFGNCVSLERVQISASLRSLGQAAFFFCRSLKSLTFPKTLTHLGNYAFEGCSSLGTLRFEGNAPEGFEDSFGVDTPSRLVVEVVQGSTGWPIETQTCGDRSWRSLTFRVLPRRKLSRAGEEDPFGGRCQALK